jgi:hypothetical protein
VASMPTISSLSDLPSKARFFMAVPLFFGLERPRGPPPC